MRGRVVRAGLVLVGLLAPAAGAAPQPALRGAEEAAAAARSIFAALGAQRWNEVVAYMDSTAVARFRHRIIQQAWASTDYTYRPPRPDPNMPACVAEYLKLRQPVAPAVPPAVSKEQLLGLDSVEELERLAPAVLVARYLDWNDEGNRARRMSPGATVSRTARSVLGAVMASDSVALVVYDLATYSGFGTGGYDRVSLLELVRRGAAWKIASPDALMGYGPTMSLASSVAAADYEITRSSSMIVAPGPAAKDSAVLRVRGNRPNDR